jgi:CheY-like chemotaxis protein
VALQQAVYAGRPFALALLDALMPDMDGFALVQRIKAEPLLATTSLLMLTSTGQSVDTSHRHTAGIAMSLTKPISQSDLWQAILMILSPRTTPSTETLAVAPPPMRQSQYRRQILLAEDNIVNQKLAIRLLEKWGHSVTVVGTGKEVLAAFDREAFDVILMDVQMPDMSGLEATVAIRQREQTTRRHVPIIAMTAHAMRGDRERCLAAGMDDYVAKPIQPQDLFETIERLIVPGV